LGGRTHGSRSPQPAARSPQRQVLEDLLDHLPLKDGGVDFQLPGSCRP
jgi:hypothetical protein